MHDALTIGIPVLVILFGILLNQKGLERLEGRIDNLSARIDRIQADLAQFYRTLGEHDAEISNLKGNQNKP